MADAVEQLSALGIKVSDLVDAIEAEQRRRDRFSAHKHLRPKSVPPPVAKAPWWKFWGG